MSGQYYFTLKGSVKRALQEYRYYTRRPWTLEDVGRFWNTVVDYDDINETLYTYYRRFTNSFALAEQYLPRDDYVMLDIQARSGKGSAFWHDQHKIRKSTCVDFSDHLLSLAEARLSRTKLKYELLKVTEFPLPFPDRAFDLVCSYETVEHVYDYRAFIAELTRVLSDDGIMILTCPNVTWEWVHWAAAIVNINHSEGPHRFLRRRQLLECFADQQLEVLAENSTIVLPFNKPASIRIDEFLESRLSRGWLSVLALRRTFVLRKTQSENAHSR
jgi:ubiquinone/menaquinone biosynthesis C-methylase UbiE